MSSIRSTTKTEYFNKRWVESQLNGVTLSIVNSMLRQTANNHYRTLYGTYTD